MDNSLLYSIALAHCDGVGPAHYRKLLSAFDSPERAWNATREDLLHHGFRETFVNTFSNRRKNVEPLRVHELMLKEDVRAVRQSDDAFPAALLDLHDAPFILFYRGLFPTATERMIAVVGTRHCSPYGVHVTRSLVPELVTEHCSIVSGLALGIDALAHKATLDSNGRTIAVLGCGIDRNTIGPRQNTLLAEDVIAQGGCLISEYPIGTRGRREYFPMRNRIVAGLSAGVLVIEAPLKSGALITADIALNIGRDVFAVPGAITSPLSVGTNQLIQNGAHCVLSGRDVTETLGFYTAKKQAYHPREEGRVLTETEESILHMLLEKTLHTEEIARDCNLDMATTNSTLLLMELKGLVAHLGGMVYKSNT